LANHSKPRGGRARKRRPRNRAGAGNAAGEDLAQGRERPEVQHVAAGRSPLSQIYGERPRAPWHPWPLAELLILVGLVGIVIGAIRALKPDGLSHGAPSLIAGIAAMVLGTTEVTLREHLSGYRSHATILAAMPVIVFHTAVVLGVSELTSFPRLLNIGLVAIDLAIFFVLFRLLRARFLNARTRRVSGR
jgi:hypothetical protein